MAQPAPRDARARQFPLPTRLLTDGGEKRDGDTEPSDRLHEAAEPLLGRVEHAE